MATYVPAVGVETVHVYVVTTPVVLGPVLLVQEVTLAVPEIVQLSVPPGETAPVEPITVAVNITVPPRAGVPEDVTVTDGVAFATRVELEEATADTAL